MTGKIILDPITHAALRVVRSNGNAFGDAVNQTLIFPTEIDAIQREYPILIQRDAQGTWQLTALLGFDRDENLFLDTLGWTARYVPAVHRRGPFLIGMQQRDGKDHPVIHVDLDDPRVGAAGEALFLPHGGNAPYLEYVAEALRTIHEGNSLSALMFAAFERFGLLAPITLEIVIDDGQRYDIAERFTIDSERLATLDGPTLQTLHQEGFLQLACAIRSSLGNVDDLIVRKRARQAA